MLDSTNSPLDWEKKEEMTDLDKLLNSEEKESEVKEEIVNSDNILLNININSIEDLIKILSEKWYDLLVMEWMDNGKALITFKLENVEKEKLYIQYPIYSKILYKIKLVTKLNIEEINKQQEWKWEFLSETGKKYNLFSKTVPNNLWEKVYFSAVLWTTVPVKKWSDIWKFLWFLWILSLIVIILWGAFLTFTVLKAKTVEDVSFFFNLWIDLSAINRFIANLSNIIFAVVIFIEILFTIIYFFKFFLTKKENKKRRVGMTILWITFLLITLTTLATWMYVYNKIMELPNWQELSYWYVQLYDNDKLLNKKFNKENSLIKDTKSLIWPITIKYDLNFLAKREKDKWFTIKKYIWKFDWNNTTTTLDPTVIHKFNKKWWIDVWLTVEWFDLITWKNITKTINEIPPMNILEIVKIKEDLRSWWRIVEFDASDLSNLWNIEWYMWDDFNNPVWNGLKFNPLKLISEETIVLMRIKTDSKDVKDNFNKVFVVWGTSWNKIEWEISYEQDLENDKQFTLNVKNVVNAFWNWYVKNYKWIIWNEIINKSWTIENPEKSSEIIYNFPNYWDIEVKVVLTDSNWKEKEFSKIITVKKSLFINEAIKFIQEWEELKVKHIQKSYEYFPETFWTPTSIKLDASLVKSNDFRYFLQNTEWDLNNDWKTDKTWNILDYPIDTEWQHLVWVKFTFKNKIKGDIIEVKEKIYIEWIKKEAQLDLQIEKDTTYAPVIVRFDASKSEIKNQDIVKFVYDYWDWYKEERDAINTWHRYLKNWDYIVKLTVTTSIWKSYSIQKKLILKPEQEKAIISTSLKKAPIWQWIDFSSDKSIWQINWYFWDFWDWENSIEANPTHSYSKSWIFKVTLRLDLANNNSTTDAINVEIQ